MAESLPLTRYEKLTKILERHIPRATMAAMLGRVLDERGVVALQMSAEDLVTVVEEVMIGLRLFCVPSQIPEIMLELAELCDQEMRSAESPRAHAPASRQDVELVDSSRRESTR